MGTGKLETGEGTVPIASLGLVRHRQLSMGSRGLNLNVVRGLQHSGGTGGTVLRTRTPHSIVFTTLH